MSQIRNTAFALSLLLPFTHSVSAADLDATQQLFLKGEYAKCIEAVDAAVKEGEYDEQWPLLKIRSQLATGQYAESKESLESAMKRYRYGIHLRVLGYDVYRYNGMTTEADTLLQQINDLVSNRPWRYGDAANYVSQGRAALKLGADARQVLELFYDRAIAQNPKEREAYLATGQLGLDKNDFQIAANAFQKGLKHFPNDPELLFGFAQAFAESDGKRTNAALAAVLEQNPKHTGAMLFRVDHLIDSEEYEGAQQLLDEVLKINPHHPRAWSYRAVLAHLDSDSKAEELCRGKALANSKTNPEVDHLIGTKLSQKYRFAEGSKYQRRALGFQDDYVPARIQLSQDLLRLGEIDEGWKLANEVHEKDGYDVVAYNLITLRDKLNKFRTLENEHFIVRMDAHEAQVYGDLVMDLLNRAWDKLNKKYDFEFNGRVTVEIFPEQKDFAIRTFGLPGGMGFLGVCFGKVITANSPASQGESPSNWEAVLWHEYCHVVTLQLTRNKMPRWLSEGISVFEERQENPIWGQHMNPQYREMVLGGELTPVGKLSGAFLRPKSGQHLNFAYYESSMVVEFLIDRYGFDSMKKVLADLGKGVRINNALEKNMGPLNEIEKEFETYITQLAENLAPDVDFETENMKELRNANVEQLAAFLEENPSHFAGLTLYAGKLIGTKKFSEAKKPLHHLIKLYPNYTGGNNAYRMLARVHQQLGETDDEREVLETLTSLSNDALDAYMRLAELRTEDEAWTAVAINAKRMLAVNPLLPQPHEFLANASLQIKEDEQAIKSYRKLTHLQPRDPAQVHFNLATLLHKKNDETARREVLKALEEAPRFRDAHKLLLKIVRSEKKQPSNDKPPAVTPDEPDTPPDPKPDDPEKPLPPTPEKKAAK